VLDRGLEGRELQGIYFVEVWMFILHLSRVVVRQLGHPVGLVLDFREEYLFIVHWVQEL